MRNWRQQLQFQNCNCYLPISPLFSIFSGGLSVSPFLHFLCVLNSLCTDFLSYHFTEVVYTEVIMISILSKITFDFNFILSNSPQYLPNSLLHWSNSETGPTKYSPGFFLTHWLLSSFFCFLSTQTVPIPVLGPLIFQPHSTLVFSSGPNAFNFICTLWIPKLDQSWPLPDPGAPHVSNASLTFPVGIYTVHPNLTDGIKHHQQQNRNIDSAQIHVSLLFPISKHDITFASVA